MAYRLSNKAETTSCRMTTYKRALEIREKNLGVEDPRTAQSYYKLAQLYSAQGRYQEAEPLYLKAITTRAQTLGPNHTAIAAMLDQYAVLLHKMNKEEQARKIEERARKIRLHSSK